MIKVLFISQWYPHRYDLMAGLFVQKHAEAVALFCDVKVLYVHDDGNIKTFEIVEKKRPNLTELTVYYPCKKGTFLYKFKKTFNYARAYWIGYKKITADGFLPDVVHANILTRTGFIAYLYKCWKGIPYVVTEHWTRYLPNQNGYKGIIRKFITKIVIKNAEAIMPVSEMLKNAMLSHGIKHVNYQIINNVVDDFFFNEFTNIARSKKRILHISCFNDIQKNISGIIRVALALTKIRRDFELVIVGDGVDFNDIINYAESLDFPNGILNFTGEKTSEEVANWLHNSDFFVLFSNYETAGVVIAESLVCGKPVLSTKVGAAPDYINERNGILIPVGDEDALLYGMNYLLDNLDKYNNIKIKAEAEGKFSYKNIGSIITEIYNQAIN